MNESLDRIIVLIDNMRGEETLLGWCVPSARYDEFLAAVDEAAQSSGAVPFSEIDFERFDEITELAMNRAFLDDRDDLIEEAERLIGGEG